MNDRAKHWKASFLEMRSFLIELMINRKNSSFCSTHVISVTSNKHPDLKVCAIDQP